MAQNLLGIRVVRGPDWPSAGDVDGGAGGVGTVVEISNGWSAEHAGPSCVTVQWDTGKTGTYRCGGVGERDLRILDTTITGTRHEGVACSLCCTPTIAGVRWQCRDCEDGTCLCSVCYNDGCYDIDHRYSAIYTVDGERFDVPKRNGAARVMSTGIFIGAEVKLCPSASASSDASKNLVGIVTHLCGESEKCARGFAVVHWFIGGAKEQYSVGNRGKVELQCVKASKGGHYYVEHLPCLQILSQHPVAAVADSPPPEEPLSFTVPMVPGSLVQVPMMEKELLQMLQEQVNSWSNEVMQMFHMVGVVERLDAQSGAVHVYYPSYQRKWVFHQAVLATVPSYSEGSKVSLIQDTHAVREMMKRLGQSDYDLDQFSEVAGKVLRQQEDHSVLVQFADKKVRVHPGCLEFHVPGKRKCKPTGAVHADKLKGSSRDTCADHAGSAKGMKYGDRGHGGASAQSIDPTMLPKVIEGTGGEMNSHSNFTRVSHRSSRAVHDIVSAICSSNASSLRNLLSQDPHHIMNFVGKDDMTYMHIAVMHSTPPVLKTLVEFGCDVNLTDAIGNPPLFNACSLKKIENTECLLQLGADPNFHGRYGSTALHFAAERGQLDNAKLLLQHGAEVDTINDGGFSPLHDAIRNDHALVVELLLDSGASISKRTPREFNAAQHATFHGSTSAVAVILDRAPEMIVRPLSVMSQHTLLHIAAINNFSHMLLFLLNQPLCEIDARDSVGSTPTSCAVAVGGRECVEQLVIRGADLSLENLSGNTPLHVAISRHYNAEQGSMTADGFLRRERDPDKFSPQIAEIQRRLEFSNPDSNRMAAIACFLAQHGCDINYNNFYGQTPMTGCINDRMRELLVEYRAKFATSGSGCENVAPPASRRVTNEAGGYLQRQTMSGMVTQGGNNLARQDVYSSSDPGHSTSQRPLVDPSSCHGGNCRNAVCVTFQPCGHRVTCKTCCLQFNLCGVCSKVVDRKVADDGTTVEFEIPAVTAASRPARDRRKQAQQRTRTGSFPIDGCNNLSLSATQTPPSPTVSKVGLLSENQNILPPNASKEV